MVRFVSPVAAMLFLIGTCTLATAAPAAEERQLSASGEGTVASWNWALFASCEATHLGHSFLYIDYFPDLLENGILFPFGGSLRSASGDNVFFLFDVEYYEFDPATGVVATTATITGGTGRFQGATGSVNVAFDFDASFGRFGFGIDGLIDY